MENLNPVVVIPTFTKLAPLKRLLKSIRYAEESQGHDYRIIFKHDFKQNGVLEYLREISTDKESFELRINKEHLGLEQNLLSCIQLSEEFGSVIILEDDLIVHPGFYKYAQECINFYGETQAIASYSLYNPDRNKEGFQHYGSLAKSSYFLRKTPTWGEVFTARQWNIFSSWLKSNKAGVSIPDYLEQYPDDNWEKLHNTFLCDTRKTVLYPPYSFSSQFGDKGIHVKNENEAFYFHSPMAPLDDFIPRFEKLNESLQFDEYFQPESEFIINNSKIDLRPEQISIDLHGNKFQKLNTEYCIGPYKSSAPLKEWSIQLNPLYMNIVLDIEGDDLCLTRKADITGLKLNDTKYRLKWLYKKYPDISIKSLIKLKLFSIFRRLFKKGLNA